MSDEAPYDCRGSGRGGREEEFPATRTSAKGDVFAQMAVH